MSTSRTDILPTAWNHERDVTFFRITSRLFSSEYCLGATVLLATYDDEPVTTPSVLPAASWVAPRPGDERIRAGAPDVG